MVNNALNTVLKNELIAINQYFLHSRLLGNMGYKMLAAKEYEESIDEMRHADLLVKRIICLGGIPDMSELGSPIIGKSPEEMIKNDLTMEKQAHRDLLKAHAVCADANDPVSSTLVENILTGEEDHIEWLKSQLNIINEIGIQNYLQSQIVV